MNRSIEVHENWVRAQHLLIKSMKEPCKIRRNKLIGSSVNFLMRALDAAINNDMDFSGTEYLSYPLDLIVKNEEPGQSDKRKFYFINILAMFKGHYDIIPEYQPYSLSGTTDEITLGAILNNIFDNILQKGEGGPVVERANLLKEEADALRSAEEAGREAEARLVAEVRREEEARLAAEARHAAAVEQRSEVAESSIVSLADMAEILSVVEEAEARRAEEVERSEVGTPLCFTAEVRGTLYDVEAALRVAAEADDRRAAEKEKVLRAVAEAEARREAEEANRAQQHAQRVQNAHERIAAARRRRGC